MSIVTDNPDTTDLGYVPPRVVSFGWIGEAFTLFGARPGVWVLAVLVAFGLPLLAMLLLDYVLGDPLGMHTPTAPVIPGGAQVYYTRTSSSNGQWVFLIGMELFFLILSSFFYGALYRMAVEQVRGRPITVRDIFRGGRVFGPVTGFTLLFLLAMLGLEILCFAPFLIGVYSGNSAVAAAFGAPGLPNNTRALFIGLGLLGLGLLLFLISSVVLVGLLLPGFALVADGERVWASFRRSIRGMKGQWFSAAVLVLVIGLLILISEIPLLLGLLVTLPMFFLLSALAYRDMIGMPGMVFPAPPSYGPPQEGVWPPPPSAGQSPPPTWGPPPPQNPPP